MHLILPTIFDSYPTAAVSTRQGGVSPEPYGMNLSFRVGDREENVRRNRELFCATLGVRVSELAIPGQVHGSTVLRVATPGTYPDCDALLTNAQRVFLCVTIADCVPIFLHDPRANAVAAVHAGWKGTSEKILVKAMHSMEVEFGTRPASLRAYLGPAAGVCCYEVGEDVAELLDPAFVERRGSSLYADLKSANRQQLADAGVPASQIEVSPHCTVSEDRLFHSHRREKGLSGRMMGVIGLPGIPPIH